MNDLFKTEQKLLAELVRVDLSKDKEYKDLIKRQIGRINKVMKTLDK